MNGIGGFDQIERKWTPKVWYISSFKCNNYYVGPIFRSTNMQQLAPQSFPQPLLRDASLSISLNRLILDGIVSHRAQRSTISDRLCPHSKWIIMSSPIISSLLSRLTRIHTIPPDVIHRLQEDSSSPLNHSIKTSPKSKFAATLITLEPPSNAAFPLLSLRPDEPGSRRPSSLPEGSCSLSPVLQPRLHVGLGVLTIDSGTCMFELV